MILCKTLLSGMFVVGFLVVLSHRLVAEDGGVPRPEVWASSWDRVPAGLHFITPQLVLEGSFDPGQRNAGLNPEDLAARTQQLPKGRRALRWVRYFNSFWSKSADTLIDPLTRAIYPGPWQETTISKVKEDWSRWLFLFKYCGGSLDLLIGDCERDGAMNSWGLKPEQIPLIVADPRWTQPHYSLPPLAKMMESVNLDKIKSAPYTSDYLTWNLQMGKLAAAILNEAIWGPAAKEFPELRGSNYQGRCTTDRPSPNYNGHQEPQDNVVGTAAAPALYGIIEAASTFWFLDPSDSTRLDMKGTRRMGRGPWQSLLMDQQTMRCCRRSAPSLSVTPWIASPMWPGDIPGTVGYPEDPRYFDENIRHCVLLGADLFLWWNPSNLPIGGKSVPHVDNDRCAVALNDLLREINAQTGGRVSRVLTSEPLKFDALLLTSGAECGTGNFIWRTTVAPSVRSVRDARTGLRRDLTAGSIGWWDNTNHPEPPAYEVVEVESPTGEVAGSADRSSSSR